MKLGEVVTHAPALGKEPTVVQDSPGFASSRLGKGLYTGGKRVLALRRPGVTFSPSPPCR